MVVAQEIARYKRYAVRQGKYKLHFERHGLILALYDIIEDPNERIDLSRNLTSMAQSLRQRAKSELEEQDFQAGEVGGVALQLDPKTDAEARERLEALGYLQ